jgi:DNA polymerase III subunit chi
MTRIDFYQIDGPEPPLQFTCRLVEKIYRQGLQVYVHTSGLEVATELDELLWTFRPDRFIPHSLLLAPEEAPVRIGFGPEPANHQEVLVNLSPAVPEFFSRYDRVTEVVPLEPTARAAARDHYKYYQDRGYSLKYHAINKQHG